MKNKSIFEKLVSNDNATAVPGGETHEFFAEQLEARVLYSAAPIAAPDAVAIEASDAQAEGSFESIDSFKNAAEDQTTIQKDESLDAILTLTSFDDIGIEEPATFDTTPVAFKRFESNPDVVEISEIEPGELTEAEIVAVDALYFGESGRYEFEVDGDEDVSFELPNQSETNRLTALGLASHTFGSELLGQRTNIFGFAQIERSLEDWVEFVA